MNFQHITARDRAICRSLHENRVLTTEHLADLYFDSLRRTRRRMQILARRGLVDRFRPHRSKGTYPWHWVLGELGARLVAAELGVELKALGYRKDRVTAIAFSPRLGHLLDTNSAFCRLYRACRDREDVHFTDWWPEQRCAEAWNGLVRPDGLGILDNGSDRARFFLELDRGTENGTRLEQKLLAYQRIARFRDAPALLLFVFQTELREAQARRHLHNAGMRIATATLAVVVADPLADVWLPIRGDRRTSLVELLFGASYE